MMPHPPHPAALDQAALAARFEASPQWADLAHASQRDYRLCAAAQRAADARYEEKRRGKSRPGVRVLLTLTERQAMALDAMCLTGETRQDAIKRLAGLSKIQSA